MEKLLKSIAEILEVEEVDCRKKLSEYEEWDSLAGLSLIALLDSDYGITMNGKEIQSFDSIEDLCNEVLKRTKL